MERCCSTCSIIGSRSPATTSTSITPWRRRSPFRKRASPSSATPRTLSEEQGGLLEQREILPTSAKPTSRLAQPCVTSGRCVSRMPSRIAWRPPGWHSLALLRAGVFRGCPVGLHGANAWVVVLRGKKKAEGDCECGSEGMMAHLRKTSENYRFRGTSDYLVAFDHGPAKNGPLEAPA